MENNKMDNNKMIMFYEVELNDIEVMEENVTPALGGLCGLGCVGTVCGVFC